MRTLLLLRHATASMRSPTGGDHDRPLDATGQREADALRAHLRDAPAPESILCSTATRTRETIERLRELWPDVDVRFDPVLYGAGSSELVSAARTYGGDAATLLICAHNPGISHAASHYTGQRLGLPPAGLVRLEFTFDDWTDFDWDSPGRLTDLWMPRP